MLSFDISSNNVDESTFCMRDMHCILEISFGGNNFGLADFAMLCAVGQVENEPKVKQTQN